MNTNFQNDFKMKEAAEFEMQGKFLHALQIYESIINDNPEFIDAYFNLADIYEKLGNIKPAVALLESFLEKDPDNKKVRLYYGQYLLRNNRWNEAILNMSYLSPDEEPIIYFFFGYCHFMLKEFELAKINFINFLNIKDPTDLIYEAYLYLAKIEINLNDFESALHYAKKTDPVYSDFWELNLILSVIFYNLGMYAHSIVPVEKAIKLNTKEPVSYNWAGKIYLKSGDYLKAEKNFKKYIELIEEVTSETYAELAEACLRNKKTKDAINYYDLALKIDPANFAAAEGKKNAKLFLENTANDG